MSNISQYKTGNMFPTLDSVEEAQNRLLEVVNRIDASDRFYVLAAVQTLVNTLVAESEKEV